MTSAIKKWKDEDDVAHALVFTPMETQEFVSKSGKWVAGDFQDKHNFGVVPVVPLVTVRGSCGRTDDPSSSTSFRWRMREQDGDGHDGVRRVPCDAAALGLRLKQSDFVDRHGNPLSTWSKVKSRLWANENPNIKVGQFDEADLTVFHNTIKLLAQLTSQLAALPPHYMNFVGDNPTSADAIRSSETQLVKRIERKHTFLGGAWEEVQRINLMYLRQSPSSRRATTNSKRCGGDPSTPTVAQKADAAVKKYESGIVPLEQTRIDLGYSATQREQMRRMDDESSAAGAIARFARPGLGDDS
ncbi:phage portal protein [Rhodococcus hoagii]|nr:phage portal protein [Prescottella equi]